VGDRYELDEPVFVLYTNRGTSGTVEDIDDEFEEILDKMAPDTRLIALRYLQIFEGIVEEQQPDDEDTLTIYKQLQLEKLPDAIDRVDWDQTVEAVAGQLMSALVLTHALPNANHRTSISLAEWYLESTDSGFSLPELATTDDTWKQWVDDYIVQSKRLLTVRRNTTAFSLLEQWGCEIVERKGDIEIELAEYELDMSHSEALRTYAEQHRELCTEFMTESLRRADYEDLVQTDGPGKAGFVQYLKTTP
jgi:prophage maintenance system killer protein